ncbi:MAG: DNA recombination protein RmuC [Pseudomonadales bacterium]
MPDVLSLLRELAPLTALVVGGLVTSGITAVVFAWTMRRQRITLRTEADSRLAELHSQALDKAAQTDAWHARETTRLEQRLAENDATNASLRDDLSRARSGLAAAEARFSEYRAAQQLRESSAAATRDQLKADFENLANQLIEKESSTQRKQLLQLLEPLRGQLDTFRKRVDEVHDAEVRDRASLLGEVRHLQQASERVNQEAANLARALKGDTRLQGSWGEMVLARVLEQAGLREYADFDSQVSIRNANRDLKRPDVLIRLPEERHVVIDAKVSLGAWEAAVATDSDDDRSRHLRLHAQHIRQHVRRLAEQDYAALPGLTTPDFVLMFVPVEAALAAAMRADETLVTEAFGLRIALVGPTTLLMTLRIIENLWRSDQRNRNAEEIARRAGALYDKLRLFVDDMEAVRRSLDQALRAHESAFARLAHGRGNAIRQAEQLRQLGARTTGSLPAALLETALDEAADGASEASSDRSEVGA